VGQRFRSVGVVAVVVALATVAGACAKGVDTSEVSADSADSGVTLPTSTTIARAGNGNTANASTSGSRSRSKTGQTDVSGTAQQLISKLASDPSLLSQLTGGDAAALSRITGIDPATLAQLQITPQTVKGLATILTGLDPTTLGKLSGSSKLDPQVAATILSLAAQLDPAAAAAIKGVDPLAIASLISAATTVDPKVLGALGGVLQVVDPNGLGKLAGDKSSLAILAVLFGVALRTDPSKFAQLANANNLDPNVNFVLSSIGGLVSGFTPQLVNQLNGISKVLGPDLLRALGAILGLLGRPSVAAVVQKAAADPVVIVTVLGTIGLLVPGLAEVISPGTFSNPQARYGALAGLLAIAIANLNGLDLNALATQLGLPPLSPDFTR
jgi:hypothetical protein